jgi:hypothetical protein
MVGISASNIKYKTMSVLLYVKVSAYIFIINAVTVYSYVNYLLVGTTIESFIIFFCEK